MRSWDDRFGHESPWLAVTAGCTIVELAWWLVNWSAGRAPAPFVATYLTLAFVALALTTVAKRASRRGEERADWRVILLGTLLVAVGASLFLPLKVAIPHQVPFWLDGPLAAEERAIFGADPWRLLDRAFGASIRGVDWLYGLWLPVQLLVLFSVITAPASPAKSRALTAYALAWLLLGVVAATIFSSAGPLFYDRLFGGSDFAALGEALRHRGAVVVLAESDAMWASTGMKHPGLVAGISAFPSLHVAVSLWIYLAARIMTPRLAPLALAYFIFMWVASVQLGWHYVSDGLAGAGGMLAIWPLAARLDDMLTCINQQDCERNA